MIATGRAWACAPWPSTASARGAWASGRGFCAHRSASCTFAPSASCRNVYGVEIPYTVEIGRRVVFEHQGGIVIHGKTRIGDDCIIRQSCTLGIRSVDQPEAAPILEAGVELGAGAVVLGAVRIGAGRPDRRQCGRAAGCAGRRVSRGRSGPDRSA